MAAKNTRVIRAFGMVLRNMRRAKGLTQEELSERAQYAPHYISILENGHFQPSLSTIVSLEEALGLDGGELVKQARALASSRQRRRLHG